MTNDNHPIFDVEILEINKFIPGTADVVDLWGDRLIPKHKNVLFQIKLCSNTVIRNLKLFGRTIASLAKVNKPYQMYVCYMESPDAHKSKYVVELTRALYPAGKDGIPKIVEIEYYQDGKNYIQAFNLNRDHVYIPDTPHVVKIRDIQRIIAIKNSMIEDFYKDTAEVKAFTHEEVYEHPAKRYKYKSVIITSAECQDTKWNTDGGFGKYEVFDFCDQGLLLWDNQVGLMEVDYYQGCELKTQTVNRLLCLPFETIEAYDLTGNSGYNMPIIYGSYEIGENPFKYYYRNKDDFNIIDNGLIVEVRPM